MWYKYMYIWYCITMYYMVSWIRWCLCGQIHRRCFPLRWSWIQILSCAPSKRGSNHNISQYCQWFFQLMSFFCEMGFLRLLKKIKLPNSSALCGKASAARLELFSGCLFHRQRWGCVNGCILYISIYEYVYNCVCGYYVKYIITYISMTIGMVYYTTHLWWF